jgi:hypothetical protein
VQGVLDAIPVTLIVIAGIFAPLVGFVAGRRARNPAIWFVYGALTGPVALVVLLAAPAGRCPDCDTPVAGWPATCRTCGASVGGLRGAIAGPAPSSRPVTVGLGGERPRSVSTTGVRVPVAPPSDAVLAASPAVRLAGATAASSAPAPSRRAAPDPAAEKILAMGVYLSGNAGMEVGAVYALARVGDLVRVFGPTDAGQLTVRFERQLDAVDVTSLEDRIIVAARSGRTTTSFVLRAVGGMRGETLEAALATGLGRDVAPRTPA